MDNIVVNLCNGYYNSNEKDLLYEGEINLVHDIIILLDRLLSTDKRITSILKEFCDVCREINILDKTVHSDECVDLLLDQLKAVQYGSVSYRKDTILHLKSLFERVNVTLNDRLDFFEASKTSIHSYFDDLAECTTENEIVDSRQKIDSLKLLSIDKIASHPWFSTCELRLLSEAIVNLTARLYYNGNIVLAAHKLRGENPPSQSYKHGAILVLLFWSLSECFGNDRSGYSRWQDPTFSLFLTMLNLLLLLWMWGVTVSVCRSRGIDFVTLLQLRHVPLFYTSSPENEIFRMATDMTLLVLSSFVLYNKARTGAISPTLIYTLIILLISYFIYQMYSPLETKRVWWKALLKVLCAPSTSVTFTDSYVGDLLTSLVKVSITTFVSCVFLWHLLVGFLSGDDMQTVRSAVWAWSNGRTSQFVVVPILTLGPLWIRLVHCMQRMVESGHRWPHMGNAVKYLSAFSVICVGTYSPATRYQAWWVATFLWVTVYQFLWDVFMDWGLFELRPESHRLFKIRDVRLLGSEDQYLFVMLFNFCLRFSWTLSLLPESTSSDTPVYNLFIRHLTPIVTSVEIVRRMIWGILRLEYEHIDRFGSGASTLSSGVMAKMAVSSSRDRDPPTDLAGARMGYQVATVDWVSYCPGLHTWLDVFVRKFFLPEANDAQILRVADCSLLLLVVLYVLVASGSFSVS